MAVVVERVGILWKGVFVDMVVVDEGFVKILYNRIESCRLKCNSHMVIHQVLTPNKTKTRNYYNNLRRMQSQELTVAEAKRYVDNPLTMWKALERNRYCMPPKTCSLSKSSSYLMRVKSG